MIEDVAGGLFKVIARFLGYIFLELIFELLLKGPGYFICKQLTKNDSNPDGVIVVFIGFLFWVVLGLSAYGICSAISEGSNV